jgi:NAD(P)H-hydrate epimerase
MLLCSAETMREIDRTAICEYGIPSTYLMTNAARAVFQAALARLPETGGMVAVFCGPGNNGGDGVAAAAFLLRRGVKVRTFLVGSREKMTADTLEMERRLVEQGGVLEDFSDSQSLEQYLARCDIVIDALFGTGLRSPLRGDALRAVTLINETDAFVISTDIPSGVHADTGKILGAAVSADETVTFALAKAGLFLEPGCTLCGKITLADIGIPRELTQSARPLCYAVMDGDISLPRRRPDTHKGDYGRALIVAGSVGYTGAPVLAAKAATVTGAGLVTLAVPESIYTIAAVKCTEEMVVPLPGSAEGTLSSLAAYSVTDRLSKADVCLLGPGLGRTAHIREIVTSAIKNSKVPLVLDADGINAAAENIDVLDEAVCPIILTPHDGEFARLTGHLPNDDPEGRLEAARRFAKQHGVVVVLKGHRTITALPDGSAYVNTTGGPAMAKGGSGDVLAGMITALIAQKFPIKDAVLAAVYLHGLAGDMAARRLGEYSVTASAIIEALPEAIASVTS